MKKIILTLLLALMTIAGHAQEKGFYLTGAGSIGMNTLRYTLDDNNTSSPKFGYGFALGVQYYFTPNWGLATGVGLSYYRSKASFSTSWQNDPSHYSFANMYDNDPNVPNENYTLRLSLNNWTETQQAYFLEVPLMLMYQTRWGIKKTIGMYFGVGAKLQLPIMNEKYEIEDESELSVVGYYPASGITLGERYQRDNYGFGKDTKIGYKGDMDLKMGFAATGEIGLLFDITPRLDLTVGAYLDYGFSNLKNGNKTETNNLIEPESQTIQPSDYIGDNIQYNGYVNSYAVDKVNALAYGAKIGIRLKLGKPKQRLSAEELEALATKRTITETNTHTSSKDTVFIIYVPQQDTTSKSTRTQPTDDDLRILVEPIFFDLDKDVLLPASNTVLNRKVAIMERYPHMRLLITGNTCDIGSSTYNVELGQRRATAAKKYLENLGIGKDRVSTVSQSFVHPLAPNNNEENREKNRRCDFYPTGY